MKILIFNERFVSGTGDGVDWGAEPGDGYGDIPREWLGNEDADGVGEMRAFEGLGDVNIVGGVLALDVRPRST